jgi:hypothetical protein
VSTHAKPTIREQRMTWVVVISRNGQCLILGRTQVVPPKVQSSMTMVWNQTKTRRCGGFSRREARRGGRTKRGGKGNCRPTASGRGRSHIASAAVFSTGPAEGGVGNPGSLHGAHFTHVFISQLVCLATGGEAGGGSFDPCGPQQQDGPRHPRPHLQLRVCGSASKLRADETEAA